MSWGLIPEPNPEVFKGIMNDKTTSLDQEIGERAGELEARRAGGEARGPLRTALTFVGITLVVFALALAYWLLFVR